MVYYIRFLKTPKVTCSNKHEATVKAVITVTTDLGDDFYPCDLDITVVAFDLWCEKLYQIIYGWRTGMRALPIGFTLKRKMLVGPVRLELTSGASAMNLLSTTMPEIVNARSEEFELSHASEAGKYIERCFRLSKNSSLHIKEDTGNSIARHIWDAGITLAAYLHDLLELPPSHPVALMLRQLLDRRTSSQLNILELGSGCGIVGLTVAHLVANCSVLLTDLPEAMDILGLNMSIAKPLTGSEIKQLPLDWNEDLPVKITQVCYDLILISDCTYNPNSLQALVQTLSALVAKSKNVKIVVSMKVRHPSESIFFDLMAEAGLAQRGHDTISLPDKSRKTTAQDLETIDILAFAPTST